MQIIEKKVVDLIPYVNNPRKNDSAVDAVANSIKSFGFKVPIIIDSNNEIVTGHTRLKAAIKLGMDKVPCVIADDLSPEQIQAFRIADNKVAELAEWDEDKLRMEFESISNQMFTGFDLDEIESLFDDDITEAKAKELTPYQKGHYLITVDINRHDAIVDLIQQLRETEGVQVDSSFS